jgi:hypothetical protein
LAVKKRLDRKTGSEVIEAQNQALQIRCHTIRKNIEKKQVANADYCKNMTRK